MPDFALPQAVQYDNTAGQMLYKLAEEKRQEARYAAQLKKEDDSRKYQLLQSINPSVLSKDFDKSVVDKTIGELQSHVSQFLGSNPNASSTDLQTYIQSNVGKIAQWSANVTQTRESIKEGIKNFNNKRGIDVGLLGAAATHNALYNSDGSLKTADQLDPSQDWVGNTLKSNIGQFTNMQEVGEDIPKFMKSFDKDTREFFQFDQHGRKIDSTKRVVTYNPQWQNYDEKSGKVSLKTVGNTGYITQPVYELFVQPGSPMEGYLDNKANAILSSHNNDIKQQKSFKIGSVEVGDPGNKELIKRAILSNYLKDNASSDNKLDIKDITKPAPINIHIGEGKDVNYIKAYEELSKMFNNDKTIFSKTGIVKDKNGKVIKENVLGIPMNTISPAITNALLFLANGANQGEDSKYNYKNTIVDKDEEGKISLYEIGREKIKGSSSTMPIKGDKIYTIDQYSLDDKVNQGNGQKVSTKIINDNTHPKQNIQTITADAFRKMSVNERVAFKSKGGIVK